MSAPDPNPDLTFVRLQLAAAGITPSDGELTTFSRLLPGLRAQLDRAYTVPTADVAPIATFRPGAEEARS